MSDQILTINLNEEYRIKIEDPEQLSSSFFKDVYEHATNATSDIIEQTREIDKIKDAFQKERQEYNNIIAFTGDRGTGKTSAMVSFAQYLLSNKDEKEKAKISNDESLLNCKFISIPTIDPSLFEEDENIVEVMLAQMFSQFEGKIKEKDTSIDLDNKRKILELFEKVYENLQTIKNGTKKYDGEAIETLSKLACSTKLRDNFKKLVFEYITLLSNNRTNSNRIDCNFLIIPIDDFDLNVKGAVEMSEQIRKYFMIPNVIILMSVNMTQLKDAKELSIRKDFKEIVGSMEEAPSKMATQYLLKLIPDNRRIKMPLFTEKVKVTVQYNGTYYNFDNAEHSIYSLIYDKTGVLLVSNSLIINTKNKKYTPYSNLLDNCKPHYGLFQSNLRFFKELLLFLIKELGSDQKINIVKLKDQLYHDVILHNINDYNKQKLLKELLNYDVTRINKHIITKIFSLLLQNNEADSDFKSDDDIIKLLTNKNNNPKNVSFADVFYMLDKYEQYYNNSNEYEFIDLIKIIYNIRITELLLNNNHYKLSIMLGDSILSKSLEDQLIKSDPSTGISRQMFPLNPILLFEDANYHPFLLLFTHYSGSLYEYYNRRSESELLIYKGIDTNYPIWINPFSILINNNLINNKVYGNIEMDIDYKKEINNKITNFNFNFPLIMYSVDFIDNILNKEYFISIKTENKSEIINKITNQLLYRINLFSELISNKYNFNHHEFSLKEFPHYEFEKSNNKFDDLFRKNIAYESRINNLDNILNYTSELLRPLSNSINQDVFDDKINDIIKNRINKLTLELSKYGYDTNEIKEIEHSAMFHDFMRLYNLIKNIKDNLLKLKYGMYNKKN